MKFNSQVLSFLLKTSFVSVSVATGTMLNKPAIVDLGIVSGILTGGQIVLDKQNKQQHQRFARLEVVNNSLQQELIESQQANNNLNHKLETALAKIAKHQHQLKTQLTRQRLNLSAVQKLRHQHKIVADKVADCEQQLSQQTVNKPCLDLSNAQKIACDRIQALPTESEITTHIYIDGNNLKFALDALQIELDYVALRIQLTPETGKTNFKFYTGIHEMPSQGQNRFIAYLRNAGYEVITLKVSQRDNHNWKTVGDDIQIALDMFQEVKNGDRIILVSGDGDFIPVVRTIQERDVEVTVLAKSSMLSRDLEEICDRVVYLDDIKYQIAKHTKVEVA